MFNFNFNLILLLALISLRIILLKKSSKIRSRSNFARRGTNKKFKTNTSTFFFHRDKTIQKDFKITSPQ